MRLISKWRFWPVFETESMVVRKAFGPVFEMVIVSLASSTLLPVSFDFSMFNFHLPTNGSAAKKGKSHCVQRWRLWQSFRSAPRSYPQGRHLAVGLDRSPVSNNCDF